jgi:hypothetical protein
LESNDDKSTKRQFSVVTLQREGRTILIFKCHNANEKSQEDMNSKRKQIYKKLNLSRWVTLGNKRKQAFQPASFRDDKARSPFRQELGGWRERGWLGQASSMIYCSHGPFINFSKSCCSQD